MHLRIINDFYVLRDLTSIYKFLNVRTSENRAMLHTVVLGQEAMDANWNRVSSF